MHYEKRGQKWGCTSVSAITGTVAERHALRDTFHRQIYRSDVAVSVRRKTHENQSGWRDEKYGGAACAAPPELSYPTIRDGKISSLVVASSVTLVSTIVSKQLSHFQQCQT